MKRKRMGSLVGAALALSLVLTGCQGVKSAKLDPKNPVTVTVWHYYAGGQQEAFNKLVSEFNSSEGLERGIVVEAENHGTVEQLASDVKDSLAKKVGAAEVPGIICGYGDTIYDIDKGGNIVSLDEYLSEDELKEYIPSYIEEGRLGEGDKLKIFPTAKSTEIFMMNKTDWDVFAEATGASLDKLETIEGVVETAKAYYEWTDARTPDVPDDGKAFFGRDAVANYLIVGSRQLGIELCKVKDGKVTFNTDKEVLRKLWDCYYVPSINGYFGAYGKFRSDDAKVGDLLAFVGSTTSASYFPKEVFNEENESHPIEALVLPVPVFADGEKYAVQQGAGMAVIKSDAQKEYAAVEFLKWFTQADRNLEFAVSSGYLPVKTEALDKNKLETAIANSGEQIPENLKETLEIAFDTCSSQKLYTNRPFEGASGVRSVLEYNMADKINADLEEINKLVAGGMSRAEAAAGYDTDENFESWYSDFCQKLEDTQKEQ